MTQYAVVNNKFPAEAEATDSDKELWGQTVIVHVDGVPSAPGLVVANHGDNVVMFYREELDYV
jgi:hypothetical protein